MELRHLQTFSAAAEHRSFTRAAEQLSMTQAAVSQHVAALEREFRTSLFHRGGRAVTLTDAGKRLYDYARRVLDLVDEASREIGRIVPALEGTLRIAASTVPAETLVPELVQQFRVQHPGVRESMAVSDSESATQAVEEGEAEIGFVGELPRSSRLTARPVAADELLFLVAPGHALARRRKITLSQLRKEPLIVREPGSGSRRCVEQALEAAGVGPGELTVIMETNSNDAIRSAVERGIGSAFLSRLVVARDLEAGRLTALGVDDIHARRQLYVLTDPDRISTPQLRAFLTFLEGWLKAAAADAAHAPKLRGAKTPHAATKSR